MAFVSTSTEIALIDARSNSGAITLPLTTQIPGRIITFKDTYGAGLYSTITLFTQGNDFFEDGTNQRTIANPYGNLTCFAGSTSRWYVTGGTSQNAFTTNVLTVSSIWNFNYPTLSASYNTPVAPGAMGEVSLLDNVFTSSVAGTVSTYIEFGNMNVLQASALPGSNVFRWLLGVERNPTAANGLDFKIKRWQSYGPAVRPYGANMSTLLDTVTINAAAQVGINCNAPKYTLDVFGNGLISTLLIGAPTLVPSTGNFLLNVTRDLAFKPGTTTWTIPSDRRIKENIVNADLGICYSNIKSLALRRFTYISSYIEATELYDKHVIGFIAQEVSTIMPKAVQPTQLFGFDDLHALNIDQLNMTLFGAVKRVIKDKEGLESTTLSLTTLNDQMQARVSTLEGYFAKNMSGNI